jgi:hypothetical protein
MQLVRERYQACALADVVGRRLDVLSVPIGVVEHLQERD